MANIVSEKHDSDQTRRGFYTAALCSLWGIITGALALPALSYLLLPPRTRRSEEWVEAGDIGKLPPNEPVEMVFHRNRTDGWKLISEKSTAWVVRCPDDQVVAFGPQCTHLGCAYHFDSGRNQFVCPCHNSLFSMTGSVLTGPAPRGLDRYEAKLEGNRLLLGRLRPKTDGSV